MLTCLDGWCKLLLYFKRIGIIKRDSKGEILMAILILANKTIDFFRLVDKLLS